MWNEDIGLGRPSSSMPMERLIRIFENRPTRVKYRNANGCDLWSARTLLRSPSSRGSKATFVLPLMFALLALALLRTVATTPTAAPPAPYFGSMIQDHEHPGYQAG